MSLEDLSVKICSQRDPRSFSTEEGHWMIHGVLNLNLSQACPNAFGLSALSLYLDPELSYNHITVYLATHISMHIYSFSIQCDADSRINFESPKCKYALCR